MARLLTILSLPPMHRACYPHYDRILELMAIHCDEYSQYTRYWSLSSASFRGDISRIHPSESRAARLPFALARYLQRR